MATFHSVQHAVKLFNAGLSGGEHLNQRQEQVIIYCSVLSLCLVLFSRYLLFGSL